MSKLDKIEKISDIFWQDGSVYIDGTSEQIAKLKEKFLSLPSCFLLEAEQVIEDTTIYYRRHTPSNECNRLYANIALAITGQAAPKKPANMRHHNILNKKFCQNPETAILINNGHLLKQHSLECYLADGKYFRQRQLNRKLVPKEDGSLGYEKNYRAYFAIAVPSDVKFPDIPFSIVSAIHFCHLDDWT